MNKSRMRVRFAPSPTGFMHLGNVRAALMNYLFALKKDGTFVLRIEDTDPERNFDIGAKQIIADLDWLGLEYTEGPKKGGPYAPYFQSERMHIYKEKLDKLITQKNVYRCFCSTEELERKRQRQIALKTAPRYDKACLALSEQKIQERLDKKDPFIWRMKLDSTKKVTIKDIAHDSITFDLKNFSDFPLTRQNGTYTFMFANFVDDMTMKMTHVLRGEDHLTNTAGQAALYHAFGLELPTFWHLPILCNINGKKLSKRDFGFALKDLREAGYLPEAICNYLAIIGASFKKEIMPIEELIREMNFEHSHAKGQIKYDVEKLRWVNRKWISTYDDQKLTTACLPYLREAFPEVDNLDPALVTKLIQIIKTDLITLKDVTTALEFYFKAPQTTRTTAAIAIPENLLGGIAQIVAPHLELIDSPDLFLQNTKKDAKEKEVSLKTVFSFMRFALTGATRGPGVKDLIEMLGSQEAKKRMQHLLDRLVA